MAPAAFQRRVSAGLQTVSPGELRRTGPGAPGSPGSGLGGGLNLTSGGTPKIVNTNVTGNRASTTEDNIHGIIVT